MTSTDDHGTNLDTAIERLRARIQQARQAGLSDEQISTETGLDTDQITSLTTDADVSDQT